MVPLGHRALRESLGFPEPPEHKALRATPEPPEHKALLAPKVIRVFKASRELREQLEPKVRKVTLVPLGQSATRVQQVPKAQRATKVTQAFKVYPVPQELPVLGARPALPVLLGQEAQEGQLVPAG